MTLRVTIRSDLKRAPRGEGFVCFDAEEALSLGAGPQTAGAACVSRIEAASCAQPAAFWVPAICEMLGPNVCKK